MSVTLRARTELSRTAPQKADSPEPKESNTRRRNIHHINQLQPDGADKNYANGLFNCGPAVVAMAARSLGKLDHLNDAQLVQQLGQGVVTRKGTSPEGIAQMMERADVPLGGEALGAGYTDAELKAHLLKGNKLIAQVRSSNPESQQGSAHYVLIEGMTPSGNYVVSDPLAKGPYIVTPQQLKEAVLKAPPDGGMLIPVGTGAPAAEAPAAEATESVKSNPTLAAAQGSDSFEGSAPAADGKGAEPSAAPLILNPAEAESLAAPKRAFTAELPLLEGVSTKFKETSSKPSDKQIVNNEKRNSYDLDVRYGSPEGWGHKIKEAITSTVKDLGDFIKSLFQRRSRGDAKAYETLSQLESSTFDKDKKALEQIAKADKKDPGTGVKTLGDSF
ncbi:MAG TPA: hypothetical protein VF815_27935 [Myxococcaceae bacterium]|jgi:hypothetical protein